MMGHLLVPAWDEQRPASQSPVIVRRLRKDLRFDGLLCGGSSGSAVWAAMQVAKDFPKGARILTILTDGVRNYMTKFVEDRWMRENGFLEEDWAVGTIAELVRAMPRREVITVDVAEPLSKAVTLFKERGFSQVPVTDQGRLAGILTEADALRLTEYHLHRNKVARKSHHKSWKRKHKRIKLKPLL